MTARKRETADERDRRIVREAGPWRYDSASLAIVPAVKRWDARHIEGAQAGARILNRIAKEKR